MTATPLTRAMLLIEELRKVDLEMPAQHALVLLLIAREEGITQSEAIQRLGITRSAMQRIFNRLSPEGVGNLGLAGYDLIEMRVSPSDARARQAYLTAKGRRLVQSLLHYLEG